MQCPDRRRSNDSITLWLGVALVGFILGAASLAASFSADGRDLTRQGFFLTQTRAL
jgi:hypothetical protein